ncbi:hypothetical protein L873DRAFT_1846507 [Choiromyces venosus 120613-1]|uniref:Uncharacterized protein n=1 Tax=Choiromyces venosus 120613-1 TaxID=1336337 RepID=A0A3N4J8F8_9PEZI|nr:hypothetical protein L873DRAFT_1846507 [Choiromyces venosus 120613-1]
MPYNIIVESTTPVPEDQKRLMSRTLREIGADPAVYYARWIQTTSTVYECKMGITETGEYSAIMSDKLSSPPPNYSSNRVFSQTLNSPTPASSSSASDPKAELTDNAPDVTSGQLEISNDLNDGDSDASSITSTTSTGASTPAEDLSGEPDSVSGLLPAFDANEGSVKPVTFLGSWFFPQGPDGKCRRWWDLRDDDPPMAGLGTPVRSALASQGHTGQLVQRKPFDGVWKKFPLTPEEQARQDKLTKQEADRRARFNSGGFGERAALFRKRCAEVKAAIKAPLGAEDSTQAIGRTDLPSREEFRNRVSEWKIAAAKLRVELLERCGR